MAMLAGPRKKQKIINLRAKNNAWSKDSNKFGQKMLEKMGWKPGKGLGADESGMVEHVIARYKNDSGGLGFEDKNDQWTQHEDDFNAILKKLAQDEAPQDKLLSGVSLEQKSKSSKARVHYHKFTRGKDLSRYSEKDLANIFGKKNLKEKEKVDDLVAKENATDIVTSNQVFRIGGNMSDYFNKKSIKFNPLNRNNVTEESINCAFKGFNNTISENHNTDEPNDFSFKGFSTSNDHCEDERIKGLKSDLKESSVELKKNKRKVEKCKNNFINEVEKPTEIEHKKKKRNSEIIDVDNNENVKKKKKKSKKVKNNFK